MQKMSDSVFVDFRLIETIHKNGINFVVEISLFAFNVTTEMN